MRQWLITLSFVVLGLTGLAALRSVMPSLVTTQLGFLGLGVVLYVVVGHINPAWWWYWRKPAYILLIVLLLIPLLVGQTTRGIAGWIEIGMFRFQPSQLAAPILYVAIAPWLDKLRKEAAWSWWELLKLGVVVGLPWVLILIEPDLGTAVILALSLAVTIFVAGLPWRQAMVIISLGVIVAGVGWTVMADYQKSRLTSFVNPSANPDHSYNARQALIAVGAGQLWGQGLGQGSQSHLRFLPERHTDFIFAAVAEELGWVGSMAILAALAAVPVVVWYSVGAHLNRPESLVAIGLSWLWLMQVLINVGMNVSLMPITGITLPLVSYGGSSVLSFAIMLGMMRSVVVRQPKAGGLYIK